MNNKEEKKKKEVGVFWARMSKDGNEYFTGYFDLDGKRTNLVMYHNKDKKSEKSPDARVYLSEPPNKPVNTTTSEASSQKKSAQTQQTVNQNNQEVDDETPPVY